MGLGNKKGHDVYLQVRDLETNLADIVSDISRVVGKELRGAVVYDRTIDQELAKSTGPKERAK